MANPYSKGEESITQAEHISPDKTGDNIEAKRIANYVWNGVDWERQSSSSSGAIGLLPFEFDDIQFSNPDGNGNYQTAVVENNGSTVATLTLSYDADSKLTGVTRT